MRRLCYSLRNASLILHEMHRVVATRAIVTKDASVILYEMERWGAGVEYHFQEFHEPYAPS